MDNPVLPPLPQMPIGTTSVTTNPSPKKGFNINKKAVFAFLIVIFLTIGTVSGVLLLRQRQLISQKASDLTGLQCKQIKAYDSSWTELTSDDLSLLKEGDEVRIAAIGTGLSAQYAAARFKINGTQLPESTLKTPSGDYYYTYTIPANTDSFSITAEIKSAVDSVWY